MNVASKSEQRYKVQVQLFITEMCPQCTIAINRIKDLAIETDTFKLDIINISKLNNSNNNIKKLAVTPYFVINEKFVVPGTSSKKYIKGVIQTALSNA